MSNETPRISEQTFNSILEGAETVTLTKAEYLQLIAETSSVTLGLAAGELGELAAFTVISALGIGTPDALKRAEIAAGTFKIAKDFLAKAAAESLEDIEEKVREFGL